MASMKRGSDDESDGPPSKMFRKDDSADDDGSKTRTGRIRKKSAKVLEMEEFEEIEKKQFSKKTDGKAKPPSTLPSTAGSTKKSKVKGSGEEFIAPVIAAQAETLIPSLNFQDPGIAQESVILTPVKATAKQPASTKVRDGQGSVIKLLLSSPALPTTPSVSTNVVSKTSPPVTVSVTTSSSPVVPALTIKKATAKVKAEPVVKQEPNVAVAISDQAFPVAVKTEMIDPDAAQHMMGVSLAQEVPISPLQAIIKTEPKPMKDGTGSLKMKLMMSPKESPSLDSAMTVSVPTPGIFFGRDETDGTPLEEAGAVPTSSKKKPPPKKKKTAAGPDKQTKQSSKSPSAAEQMPNLAALVSGPKGKKAVKLEETNLSMSDHIDTSMSDASLDMSSIVDSALDMEEEAALVIAEGVAATSGKQKKKRSSAGGKKKAKTSAVDLHGFDSDDGSAPPDGDLATLAAKVRRSSGVTGGKKKVSKKLQEAAAQRASLQGKKKRPPRRAPTAYMLYCNSQRPKVVAESPGIDFAQISRTLGVMWQCLSKKEKMMWRRKSKKLAGKGSTLISTGKGSRKESAAASSAAGPAMNQPSMRTPVSSRSTKSGAGAPAPSAIGEDTPQSPVKGFGIEPIDIAAHLKLLGESLSIIGMRLQEHKGLIAVQGSLSVLLDSLLCACGPLMALTQQVPGLDGCSESTHARTLDSVAYIMPGL